MLEVLPFEGNLAFLERGGSHANKLTVRPDLEALQIEKEVIRFVDEVKGVFGGVSGSEGVLVNEFYLDFSTDAVEVPIQFAEQVLVVGDLLLVGEVDVELGLVGELVESVHH